MDSLRFRLGATGSDFKKSQNIFDSKDLVIDNLVDEIRDILTPTLTAKMVL